MYLAMLRLEIRIDESPRSKRRTVRSMLDKIHDRFNVSVAEVDRSNHPTESVLAFAVVATTRKDAREILDRVLDAVGVHPRAEVVAAEVTEL